MIIKSNTEEGANSQVYDKRGNKITLPIYEYNTETKEVKYYEMFKDPEGLDRVKMGEWVEETKDGKKTSKFKRSPVTSSRVLEGSYVEIDGKKVD